MMQERHLQFVVIHLGTVANIIHLHLNRPLPHGLLFKHLEKSLIQALALLTIEMGVIVIVPQTCVTQMVVGEQPLPVGMTNQDGEETTMELSDVRQWMVKFITFLKLKIHILSYNK